MNAELTYRESAVAGASPVHLVTLLYEQAIKDLRHAIDAHTKADIEARTRHINHAILVIGHLEATLDKEQGGKVAENLQLFYEQLRSGLVNAQCQQSIPLLEQQILFLSLIHQAWCEVERAITRPRDEVGENSRSGNWSA